MFLISQIVLTIQPAVYHLLKQLKGSLTSIIPMHITGYLHQLGYVHGDAADSFSLPRITSIGA